MAIDDNASYELTGYQVKDLAQKIRAKADSSSLASVATSGLYSDLTGAPTIPTVYNGELTITQNGTSAGTFTANASSNTTIALTDTTYSAFTGTDGQTAGTAGLVPAPATTDVDKFLKSDGTWATAGGGGGGVVSFIATDMVMMKYPAVVQWMQQHSLNPSTIQSLNFSPSGGTFVLLNDAGTELAPVDAISEAFMQGSRILIKAMFMQYGGQMIQTASYNGSVLAADVITSTSTNYPFVFAFSQENMASQASTFSCKKQAQIGTYNNKTYATFQVAKSS